MDIIALEQRFRRDPLPIRLGNLAANLARISSAAACVEEWPFVLHNIRESKYFIEWTTPELPPGHWGFMIGLQVRLSQIERRGAQSWCSRASETVRQQTREWSEALIAVMLAMQSSPGRIPPSLPCVHDAVIT